ncbi:MAG TPA: hypothetical protein VFA78_03320 [Chloroflexota bacterium]|nr:hypothetical protein [Chloroflexota bacterium]
MTTIAPVETPKSRWFARTWIIVVLLALCILSFDILFPLGIAGLFLLWRYSGWNTSLKWLASLAVPIPIYLLVAVSLGSGSGGPFSSSSTLGNVCLRGPERVATGPHGSVYVLDLHRVLRFSAGGKALWHAPASGQGGLAVDAAGNVYVDDPSYLSYKNRGWIEKLSPAGRLLARWPARESAPDLVDRNGVLYALNSFDSPNIVVRRLSSTTGKQLGRWRERIGSDLEPGPGGTLYAEGVDTAEAHHLLQVSAASGRVVRRWPLCSNCMSFDALAEDAHGTLFVGLTTTGDAPFEIARVNLGASGTKMHSINTANEQVGQLAAAPNGDIYVIRDSYSRPAPTDTGLDELSANGSVVGTFQPCQSS